MCEGSGVRLLCSPGSCWEGGGTAASKCSARCYFKVPDRSFPTGSQDNEHELRAIKQSKIAPILLDSHMGWNKIPMSGALWDRPLASQTLYKKACMCCVLRAGGQVWSRPLPRCGLAHAHSATALPHAAPGLEPEPGAWCFSWTSADGLAPYLHGLTVSCLPTHPV